MIESPTLIEDCGIKKERWKEEATSIEGKLEYRSHGEEGEEGGH